jgi:carbon monoxide dehydrogenase subunit G
MAPGGVSLMARLRESLVTSLPVEQAFAFVADFANSARWDPGVAWSQRLDAGPLAVGARYRLGVRMAGRVAPMEYRISELEPDRRVVLVGKGSGVEAVDEIRFTPTPMGTQIDYSADIRLTGLLRLVEPFAGRAFASIASNAREGMQRTLDEMAERRPADAAEPAA